MRLIGYAFALAFSLGAAACNDDYGAGAPAVAPPPVDPIEATSRWVGAWSSPSCGSREYERLIKLQDDGDLRGEDRVAPCPAGGQCMWSGIVLWSGTWEPVGDRAVLTEENPPPGPVDAPRPKELEWSETADAPAERSLEGRLCVYDRVDPEVPPAPIQPAGIRDEE